MSEEEIIEENIKRYIKEHSRTIKAYTQEYVDKLQSQLQQKENIIKEAREYIMTELISEWDIKNGGYVSGSDLPVDAITPILKILDKVSDE